MFLRIWWIKFEKHFHGCLLFLLFFLIDLMLFFFCCPAACVNYTPLLLSAFKFQTRLEVFQVVTTGCRPQKHDFHAYASSLEIWRGLNKPICLCVLLMDIVPIFNTVV